MKVTEVKKRLWMMGWSQDSLVRQTGRSKSEISMVLNGYRHTATVQEAIAAAVGVSVGELFGKWAYSNNRRDGSPPPQVDGHQDGKQE
ncbi:MAG TPA: helix-turn-helix domain-containing protein [Candidatus Tripitaka californicus]|uniref:helix-turn-helix domain-containing protein n=1 Tax=Candidatus Tripitaka californicus TaxID=3367616 RepID=UPI0040286231|nr:helix-turn-helix transcriptional regulator [Planctomycetota bacterium]